MTVTLIRSLFFDGSNDYADAGIDVSLRPSSAFTLACWYYTSETGNKALISWPRSASPWYSLYLGTDRCTFTVGAVVHSVSTATIQNKWTHLAATYDGNTLSLYMNGRLVRTTAVTGNVSYENQRCTIGNWWQTSPGDPSNFFGYITDPRIYGRAL